MCSYVHNRILASNRSHIVKLPPNRVLEQFTLIRATHISVFKGVCWLPGVTAAEVHAHTPPVPADLQPSIQRGLFSNRTETLRQHFCLPVSQIPCVHHQQNSCFMRLNHPSSSFSGSHIENWHSILRNGLVNASYTKLQVEWKILQICIYSKYSGSEWQPSVSASRSCVRKRHLPESSFQYILWILWYYRHSLHLCKYKDLLWLSCFLCVQRWVKGGTECPPRKNSEGTVNQ